MMSKIQVMIDDVTKNVKVYHIYDLNEKVEDVWVIQYEGDNLFLVRTDADSGAVMFAKEV